MGSALLNCSAPPIRIRPAAHGDLDALVALEQRAFATDRLSRRSFRRLMVSPSAAVIVAEEGDGTFAGAAILLFRPQSKAARLYSIAVALTMAGRGIGGVLLQAAEEVARARGCHAVRLEVQENNHAALSRYRKSGYREFGRHIAYYEDGGDALRFEKRLGGESETPSHSGARPAGR
jgi:ribosomal protein S18 acetylase RimI-like enzyme